LCTPLELLARDLCLPRDESGDLWRSFRPAPTG
jgi:hypothetical protein